MQFVCLIGHRHREKKQFISYLATYRGMDGHQRKIFSYLMNMENFGIFEHKVTWSSFKLSMFWFLVGL